MTSQSSPMKASLQGQGHFSATKPTASTRRPRLISEMTGQFVGPMPINQFLDLLPKAPDPAPHLDCSQVPHGRGKESKMYQPLHAAIEASKCCPKFAFCDTHNIPDALTKLQPDAMLLPSKFSKGKTLREGKYMQAAEVVFELKATRKHDAFKDSPGADGKVLEVETQTGMQSLGQLIDYATMVMALQHRTLLYMVTISDDTARLIRWDRAGAIVSEAFNYVKEQHLAEFLWRYNWASRSARGFDHNVCAASEAEVAVFRRAVKKYMAKKPDTLKEHMRKTIDPRYPVYKIRVRNSKSKISSDYIVQRPFFEPLSPTGRATRGYITWSTEDKELQFLKDTWRSDVSGVPSESAVYEILSDAKVPHLATVLKSGDVLDEEDEVQSTLTDHIAANGSRTWGQKTVWLRRHVLHRVVQKLALPLHMVQSSLQLAKAIRNVLIVIKMAHAKGYLHRDISAGNVMLTDEFEGILNDWDHVIKVPPEVGSHPYRTGTWQFISAALLRNPKKIHTIADDVESAYWLLLNFAWRFFECEGIELPDELFDQQRVIAGSGGKRFFVGGGEKQLFLQNGLYERVRCQSEPLVRIIRRFGRLLSAVYQLRLKPINPSKEQQAYYEQSLKSYEDALKVITDVDEVIDIFDDEIDKGDEWPKDDARPESQKQQTPHEKQLSDVRGLRSTWSRSLTEEPGPAAGEPQYGQHRLSPPAPRSRSPYSRSPSLPPDVRELQIDMYTFADKVTSDRSRNPVAMSAHNAVSLSSQASVRSKRSNPCGDEEGEAELPQTEDREGRTRKRARKLEGEDEDHVDGAGELESEADAEDEDEVENELLVAPDSPGALSEAMSEAELPPSSPASSSDCHSCWSQPDD